MPQKELVEIRAVIDTGQLAKEQEKLRQLKALR
jgi:hypothetical protein